MSLSVTVRANRLAYKNQLTCAMQKLLARENINHPKKKNPTPKNIEKKNQRDGLKQKLLTELTERTEFTELCQPPGGKNLWSNVCKMGGNQQNMSSNI